ncbi:MAG: BamA/TamA family outer membrane protein [Parabacteroides sp.]
MKKVLHTMTCLATGWCLFSCSTTKYVEEGEYLLDKVEITCDSIDKKPDDLKSYLRQQPNFKVFGLTKWQLFVYGWSGRNEKNWLNRQLRRMGEPPVILDTTLVEQSVGELQRLFVNKGYINAQVTASIDTSHRKKAVVTYAIHPNEPYRIREYTLRLSDPVIDSLARVPAPKRSRLASAFLPAQDGYTCLVKKGGLFDRDELDQERQRITSLARNHGYYAFNKENLAYVADSSFRKHVVDLEMNLRPSRSVRADGSVMEGAHKPYYINSVTFVTDYNPLEGSRVDMSSITDSLWTHNLRILYGKNGRTVRPGVFRKSNYITPGALFNESEVDRTYASLARLSMLKNVNIHFQEFEENDSLKLDCTVLTIPAKTQSFGVELEGTNSAGDLGFASSVNYQHRNLFKGGETLKAQVRGAYESLARQSGTGNYTELGAELSINIPRFLFPYVGYDFLRSVRASTEFSLSYNLQSRPQYRRAILSGVWSYIWQTYANTQARHVFKLLDVNFVIVPHIDFDFWMEIPELLRLYNYNDQFIVATGYTYSFNSSPLNRRRNSHSLRASFEIGGNLLYALSKVTGQKKNDDGRYELVGVPYSQFVKADFDFSKNFIFDERNSLAYHIGAGVAVPYGNSSIIPYERSYFSGGANSVRGWSVRTLGPGSMPVTDNVSFVYQIGDIRLDMNVEYRSKLFWKLEMAAYVDAGNIWTIHTYEDQPNGNFDLSRFYKEIALSYGLGFRLNFDFFLLRFDTGFKAYDPQQTGSRKWAITRFNFRDNFAWHFAVGYPF